MDVLSRLTDALPSSARSRGLEDRSKLAEGSDAGKATVRYAHLDIVCAVLRASCHPYADARPRARPARPARWSASTPWRTSTAS